MERDVNAGLPSVRAGAPHPDPLPSFWTANARSPLTRRNATNALPPTADIVVIGSGITGCLVAAALAQASHGSLRETRILLLEARDFCSGATGRNGGHLSPSPTLGFGSISSAHGLTDALAAVQLEDRAVEIVRQMCKAGGWTKRVDLVEGGNVHLFATLEEAAHVKLELGAAAAAGVDVSGFHWLTAEEARARYGAKTLAAVLIPGNNIYPLKFVTEAFLAAEENQSEGTQLSLYTHCCVDSISPAYEEDKTGYRWTLKTSRGVIHTDQIVHATNAYASHLLPSLATGESRIIPTRGQVIAHTPSPSADPHWTTAFSANEGFEYFFQRPPATGGTIILGGGRSHAKAPFEFGTTDDSRINRTVSRFLRGFLSDNFPRDATEQGEMMQWTGIMGFTKLGVPLVGRVYSDGEPLDGQYISAGYSGHGMSRAPACAEAIASLVLADRTDEPWKPPIWLPQYYLTKP